MMVKARRGKVYGVEPTGAKNLKSEKAKSERNTNFKTQISGTSEDFNVAFFKR
jgi:hypothetical protein